MDLAKLALVVAERHTLIKRVATMVRRCGFVPLNEPGWRCRWRLPTVFVARPGMVSRTLDRIQKRWGGQLPMMSRFGLEELSELVGVAVQENATHGYVIQATDD